MTTRNKLKSVRFLVPMLTARRRVREQLREQGRSTRGLIRWADAIASPTEFFTLTLWANKQLMFNFMSSEAHREMMWMFTRWSDEFWSMRWACSECEVGAWNGLQVSRLKNKAYDQRAQTPIPEIARGPRAGPIDPSSCPVTAITAHVRVRTPLALWQLLQTWRRLRQHASSTQPPSLLRWAMGFIEADQYLLVTLWKDSDGSVLSRLAEELRGAWLMAWQPGDYEIGHWDGLKLRQLASVAKREQWTVNGERPTVDSDQ